MDPEQPITATRSRVAEAVAGPLERAAGLDPALEAVQAGVRRLVPADSIGKELCSGSWIGHPLHPLLTDVVVGSWLSAWALDSLNVDGGARAADELIALGVLSALPTALTGLSDWAELKAGARRVGGIHALGNVAATALQLSSLVLRRVGRRREARVVSSLALVVAGGSAWLGAHLAFAQGVGVDQTVFEDLPTAWTPLIDARKLKEGRPVRRSARGTAVLLIRHENAIHALIDRCSHRGCSLSEGSFDGTAITCPCHGSRFGLDGRLLRGPATNPQPQLETRVRDGRVEVRAPAEDSR